MNRREFHARMKYSWMLRTEDFAWALSRSISSDKMNRGMRHRPARGQCRAQRGQAVCRLLILGAMPLSIGRDRLETLLDAASRTRIVAVGDAMLDEYLVGDVERISPEAPVPVLRVRERRHALGGVANVAQNVAAIGAECRLVAAIGHDAAGTQLRGMLASINVPERGLVAVSRPTTRKTRVVARSQQLVRIDDEEDADLTTG